MVSLSLLFFSLSERLQFTTEHSSWFLVSFSLAVLDPELKACWRSYSTASCSGSVKWVSRDEQFGVHTAKHLMVFNTQATKQSHRTETKDEGTMKEFRAILLVY
ncbi:hypothetical protein RRG08_022179 [Elysia crispata]|uniref:Uncharacterized protein n=1 Tax=Elysia crispata TaxID=231223 RepID=A0AAE1AJG6_9GAST|nr:hypothetical protein RRG08_022179 [Elysia crispata]